MCEIMNESMIEGCPDEWKLTIVVPIPKVPRPKKAEELRPINMLPTVEKLLETQ